MINLQRKNVTLFINLDTVQPATPALKLRKTIICLKEEEEGVKRDAVALQRGSFGQNQNSKLKSLIGILAPASLVHLVKCESAEVLEGIGSHQLSTDLG